MRERKQEKISKVEAIKTGIGFFSWLMSLFSTGGQKETWKKIEAAVEDKDDKR